MNRQSAWIMQPKRIYLAQRHPALSREAFVARWRQHGRLAMGFMALQNWENVDRYVQCDALHDKVVSGVSDQFDGMGIIWFKDAEARKRHIGFAEARAALAVDEAETFRTTMKYALGNVTAEDVPLEGPTSGVKMVYCRSLTAQASAGDGVRAYADQRAAAILVTFEGSLRRYAQSFPLPPENGNSWGLSSHVIEELWFDDLDAVRRAYSNADAQRIHLDRTALAAEPITVLVREAVLYP